MSNFVSATYNLVTLANFFGHSNFIYDIEYKVFIHARLSTKFSLFYVLVHS